MHGHEEELRKSCRSMGGMLPDCFLSVPRRTASKICSLVVPDREVRETFTPDQIQELAANLQR